MNVLDATGDVLEVTRNWLGDDRHTLELVVGRGGVSIELSPGLLAADGTAPEGLPKVIEAL